MRSSPLVVRMAPIITIESRLLVALEIQRKSNSTTPKLLPTLLRAFSSVVLHDGCNKDSIKHKKKNPNCHGNTLFPRWLAEVLNEVCELGIEEQDIYE